MSDNYRTYHVLQPRSNTNPSEFYRVVEWSEWTEYISNNMKGFLPDYGDYIDYKSASIKRDELNESQVDLYSIHDYLDDMKGLGE